MVDAIFSLVAFAFLLTACTNTPRPPLIAPLPPIDTQAFTNVLAYTEPEMEQVGVRLDAIYAIDSDGKQLRMDLYYPPNMPKNARLPVVIFVFGFPDTEVPFKSDGQYISWGRLVAAAGMVGISYETYHPDKDLEALVAYLQDHGTELNIDANNIGLWACSAHPPTALAYAMQPDKKNLRFMVLYYGILLTPDNYRREEINQMGKDYNFYAAELMDVAPLRKDLPLFIVRAGKDETEIVPDTTDHFMEVAKAEGVPVTFVDFAEGVHGFDAFQHDEASSQVIQKTVVWMKDQVKR